MNGDNNGAYSEHTSYTHHDVDHDDGSSFSYGWIIAIIVIIIIILIIVWFIHSEPAPLNPAGTVPVWRFTKIQAQSSATDTFLADNFSVYTGISSGAAANLALTVTPSASPIGESFIIDNTVGTSNITITPSGGSVTPSGSAVVPPLTSAEYVWKSATTIFRVM